MQTNRIHVSQTFGNRMDVSFYRDRFDFISKTFPSYPLSHLLHVNPSVNYRSLSDNDDISFIPMEVIDEQNGVVAEQRIIKVCNTKGFTKFETDDLIWAKITPCMQNGKSAIVRNLVNGYGCGSTEFYVLRPKSNNILIEYIHYILRDKKILESAKNSFGGSAGQQRVSSSYLKSIQIPLPPMSVQQEIVDIYNKASNEKQAKEQEAKALLDSIDSYLLGELGITLPETKERQMAFKVNISEILGSRIDTDYNNQFKYKMSYDAICESKYKAIPIAKISNAIFQGVGKNETNDNTFTLLKVKNILIGNEINFDNVEYVKSVPEQKILKYNDIIAPFIGEAIRQIKFSIFKTNGCYTVDNNTGVIRIADYNNPNYVAEYLCSILGEIQIKRLIGGGGVPFLGSDKIGKILVCIPPIEKQTEIADRISQIRSQAKQLQAEASQALATAKQQIEKIILG